MFFLRGTFESRSRSLDRFQYFGIFQGEPVTHEIVNDVSKEFDVTTSPACETQEIYGVLCKLTT